MPLGIAICLTESVLRVCTLHGLCRATPDPLYNIHVIVLLFLFAEEESFQ